jgi:hypothetical protein
MNSSLFSLLSSVQISLPQASRRQAMRLPYNPEVCQAKSETLPLAAKSLRELRW